MSLYQHPIRLQFRDLRLEDCLEKRVKLYSRKVLIACEAQDIYYKRCNETCSDGTGIDGYGRVLKHHPVLVAAAVGSYGAYLANGSEYSGDYGEGMTLENLKDFHRRRVQVFAESGADLIAFEAIPNKLEAQAYAELLEGEDIKIPAWFAFNSKDGVNVVSIDSLTDCVAIAESCRKVVAVCINCTPPRIIHDLILSATKVTSKPIFIYPYGGESYDPDQKQWVQNVGVSDEDLVSYVSKWCELGLPL